MMNYDNLIKTSDPNVFIEEQREGYVRYICKDSRRWEVHGVCTDIGTCWEGAVSEKPVLDCPVGPGFDEKSCCPLKVIVLPNAD
jgi:hypothetical protein